MRFVSHHEIEQRLTCDRMRVVVVGKFHIGDLISPGTRVGPAEDPKIHFNLLVNVFHFTVGLWIVGSGKGEVIVEEFAKLLGKGGGELWAAIRDDLVIEPKTEIDFVEKEGSYPLGSDGFLCEAENYPLHKAMVNHNQQRVKARGGGEVSDEATRDLLEGARGAGLDQGKQRDGGVCVGLVLLAHGTALNVLSHELCETQPSELCSDELANIEVTRVASSLMIVALSKDRVAEEVVWRNIDTAFICEDVVVKLPI